MTDHTIGRADGAWTCFDLGKAYGDQRQEIRKPVEGSARITVGGADVSEFSVDDRGAVKLAVAPASGPAVSKGFCSTRPCGSMRSG